MITPLFLILVAAVTAFDVVCGGSMVCAVAFDGIAALEREKTYAS